MRQGCLIILLLLSINLTAQKLPAVGKEAPSIEVETWIENPSYDFKNYEGKPIVLDFWFTSCAPCVYTTPHLNQLSEKYNNDVTFIAVTFEDSSKVVTFLQKKKILANIGSSQSLMESYGVTSFPTTFLIDSTGILQWMGHPSNLKAEMIDFVLGESNYDKLINTQFSAFINKKDLQYTDSFPIEININEYMADGGSGWQMTPHKVTMVNMKLVNIIAAFTDINANRIITSDTNSYDVNLQLSEDQNISYKKPAVAKAIIKELNYRSKLINENKKGYSLQLINDSLFIKNAIDTTKRYKAAGQTTFKARWKGEGITMSDLIKKLEGIYNIYIADETGLNAYLNIDIPTDSLENTNKKLIEKYGLALRPAEINVQFLHIEPE